MARALSQRWLAYIGKISYGLYLWHYPVFTLLQGKHWPREAEVGSEFLLSAVATLASFHLLEKPLLRMKDRFRSLQGPSDARHAAIQNKVLRSVTDNNQSPTMK